MLSQGERTHDNKPATIRSRTKLARLPLSYKQTSFKSITCKENGITHQTCSAQLERPVDLKIRATSQPPNQRREIDGARPLIKSNAKTTRTDIHIGMTEDEGKISDNPVQIKHRFDVKSRGSPHPNEGNGEPATTCLARRRFSFFFLFLTVTLLVSTPLKSFASSDDMAILS